jgi:hypothetical protein
MFGSIKRAMASTKIKLAYENTIAEMERRQTTAIKLKQDFFRLAENGGDSEISEFDTNKRKLMLTYIAREAAVSVALLNLKADFHRFKREFGEQGTLLMDRDLALNLLDKLIEGDETDTLGMAFSAEYEANMSEIKASMAAAQ